MSDTTYGLTSTGFLRKRMAEIRRELFDDLRDRTGIVWDETPDSLVGQTVAVFAERVAALWELAEAAYLAAYPVTAEGAALDLAASYSGVRRVQASASTAAAVFYGRQGTVVPVGSAVDGTALADGAIRPPRFRLDDDVVISRDTVADLVLTVSDAAGPQVYSITVDGARVEAVRLGDTSEELARVLAVLLTGMRLEATFEGREVRLRSETPLSVVWSPNLILKTLGSPGTLVAEEEGPVSAAAGTLTGVPEPVTGWEGVSNRLAASPGTLRETDVDLRRRYDFGVYRLGAATLPSLRANLLQDIEGVTSVAVYENVTGVQDSEGRPAHSFEAVVEGGEAQDVADKLFLLKPAGIQAFGNTSRTTRDDTGFPHEMRFSRPEPVRIWLRATLSTTTEETVPGDVAARAAAAMAVAGNALQVGQDVLLQRISAAVFAATSGVARVELTAATAAENVTPTDYRPNDILIGPRQRANFDVSRVAVS